MTRRLNLLFARTFLWSSWFVLYTGLVIWTLGGEPTPGTQRFAVLIIALVWTLGGCLVIEANQAPEGLAALLEDLRG